MKYLISSFTFLIVLLSVSSSSSQENITLNAPALFHPPFDLMSNGTFSFLIHNVNLPGYPADSGLKIVIEMDRIKPNDGVASLYGPGSKDFEWTYDEDNNEFTGLQIADIGFLYSTTVFVDFIVTEESHLPDELCGFLAEARDVPVDGEPLDNIASAYTSTVRFDEGISGIVFYDENQNGIQDEFENGAQGLFLEIGSDSSFAVTNKNGLFYFEAIEGEAYDITPDLENNWVLTTANPTITHTYTLGDQANATNYFGIYPTGALGGINLNLSSNTNICNSIVNYQLRYQNIGPDTLNGTIQLVKDPSLTLEFVSGNVTIDNDILSWPVSNLYPFESIDISLKFEMPDENSVGETIFMHYSFIEEVGGMEITTFENTYEPFLFCAYDPNDKIVVPVDDGIESFTDKDQTLSYTIRFENIGNATAKNVRILDKLDPNLDLSSFRVLNSSDFLRTTVNDNELQFFFNDIFLAPGQLGFISYSIKPKPGLENYTEIRNSAEIYFDQNSAIVTNTTINTLCDASCTSSTNELLANSDIAIYPNPNSGYLYVEAEEEIESLEVYSGSGQLVWEEKVIKAMNFNRKLSLQTGIYLIKLQTKNGVGVKMLIML